MCVPVIMSINDRAAAMLEEVFPQCEYMAKAIFDVEEGVAIEACEFWFALVQHSEAHVEVRKNIVIDRRGD